PARRDRQFDLLVDEALEEPGPEREAVTVGRDAVERIVIDMHRLPGLGKRGLHPIGILPRDLGYLLERQRREQDDLIDSVAELRREPAFELAHHLALHLLHANRA